MIRGQEEEKEKKQNGRQRETEMQKLRELGHRTDELSHNSLQRVFVLSLSLSLQLTSKS